MYFKFVVAAAKHGTFAATLFPTRFVVQRAAFGAYHGLQICVFHKLFHRIGTDGAMKAQLIGLLNIVIRDGEGWHFLFVHFLKRLEN